MRKAILNLLREHGPLSRPELEGLLPGYAPRGVAARLWELKRAGLICHVRRGAPGHPSRYEVM